MDIVNPIGLGSPIGEAPGGSVIWENSEMTGFLIIGSWPWRQFMKRMWRLLLLLTVVAVVSPLDAGADDPSVAARGKCKLGDSLAQCREALALRELSADETQKLIKEWPFDRTFPFLIPILKESRLVVWTDGKKNEGGWPLHVFAVFSKQGKLEDLLASHGGNRDALVNGLYSRNVESLKKGMTVDEMYRLVGQNHAEYIKNSEGKWIVEFVYDAFGGRFFGVTADAATGVILDAGDHTI